MLSLHQAIEIRASILAYLKATFAFQDKEVNDAFYDFINDPQEGMFKGPYVSLKTGFVKAEQAEKDAVPLVIKPDWPPYDHQVKSWHRLSCRDQEPQSTIVTTGTGSGKTESFLYPILDYCYDHLDRQGIKVIILYPMNALASDQAKRLGEAIFEDERLRGKVTAGLFIGEGKNAAKYPKSMGPDHIIENRDSILDSPPDILLTNFKMLDYGLMKSKYHNLWSFNLRDRSLLKFLVLDELHTYDGAQGTDVANLIRRLKMKLDLPSEQLCPVGTSATIGSGVEAPKLLAEYASSIFEAKITPEAIITENRLSAEDFFGSDESLDPYLPRATKLKDTALQKDEDFDAFIQRQTDVWQLDAKDLTTGLRKQLIVKDLVRVCLSGAGLHTPEEIARGLSQINTGYKAIPQWDPIERFSPKQALIESLFSLISVAKIKVEGERPSPFLYVQVQQWIRELSGLQRAMEKKPKFVWRDHVELKKTSLALPPWFCRECGASGWLGVKHDNKERFEQDINDVYTKFFSNHRHIYFISPHSTLTPADLVESGYEPTDFLTKYVFSEDLEFQDGPAPGRVKVLACRKLDSNNKNDHVCPSCNTRNTVAIVGTRIATLSSIAMSQTLATDLDPQPEKNRKVLAFTNSVQDAAHQAGFVEARNYRFTLRSSLQQVINQQPGPTNLKALADAFMVYWKEQADETGNQPLDAYYYRFFPKDYIGKSSPAHFLEKGKYEGHFMKEFDERVRWEIYAEFGYDSLIGRTLEKTGASAVYFDTKVLSEAWTLMQPWLAKNLTEGAMQESAFLQFLFLVLNRIRSRGAISHGYLEKFRTHDLKLWDLNWMKDSRHFLNRKFGSKTRLPRLTTAQLETRGILDSTFARAKNWFHSYFKKSFPLVSDHLDLVNEFYNELVQTLVKAKVLDQRLAGEIHNYALNPEMVIVAPRVYDLECKQCGHLVHTSDETGRGIGGNCLRFRCSGTYEAGNSSEEVNYYQAVYNRKRSPRIYAADHTGLLERKDRELLESDFKNRTKFNSTNAMVATSTLEMGIDIGTLNAAYNNSVPPLPSNFLQRIGRAGRSSGSALIVNFVQNKAHDLFYFGDPLDMMNGEVSTPGCYLEAKEILRRHFFASCIDAWTTLDPKHHHIPSMIRHMKIEMQDLLSPDFFMNRILNFIKANEAALLEKFKAHYVPAVRASVFDSLEQTFRNEQFYQFYKSIFKKIQSEIADIDQKRKDIQSMIETLKLGKEDPERIELEREKKNLGGIIGSIKKRNTLEHLTNVGALPNYAFPETGVTLVGKVLGNKVEGSTKVPLNKDYEIVRPAIQALREFAPDNYFYSQGYRFQVTGVNTFDWADTDTFHKKRFCSQCDHMELDSLTSKGNCPKCGHESWQAASNVHSFAKLLTVKSFNSEYSAKLNDSKDEREALIYHRSRHFTFDQLSSLGAWVIKEIPFGIEFVKNVRIRDINMGKSEIADARKVVINDQDVPAHGFISCRHCGKSSSNIRQPNYKQHYAYCKHKEHAYAGKADEVFEEVFFFREIQTEALKILLPVQEMNGETEVKMFQSGIELGLKKYYRGNPQHIALSTYQEFNHTTQRFDRFLVLYDRVPGGTGYLEQLFDKEAFNQLLYSAYEAIRDCGCQHSGKDGCYRCVFSYGNQYYQSELSRARAEKRFEEIVRRSEAWEQQAEGLSALTNSGKIEESELEERFVRSLRNYAAAEDFWEFQEVNDGSGMSYTLLYEKEEHRLAYHIRPQVDLGPTDGIAYYTRTDFLVICTEATLNGKNFQQEIPKVAVYLDGYQYHASHEGNIFEKDLLKRRAINANPAYRCWTLTWDDLERFDKRFLDKKEQDGRLDFLADRLLKSDYATSRKQLLSAIKKEKQDISLAQNNYERLLKFLLHPYQDEVFQQSWTLFLAFFQQSLFLPSFPPDAWEQGFSSEDSQENYCQQQRTLDGLMKFQGLQPNEMFEARTLVNVERREAKSRVLLKDTSTIDKDDWNQFWSYYNVVQFFEWKNVEDFGSELESAEVPDPKDDSLLDDLLQVFGEPYHLLIRALYEKGYIQSPEDENALNALVDENGNEIASADLIIHPQKIVFAPSGTLDEKKFLEAGYSIKAISDIKEIEI